MTHSRPKDNFILEIWYRDPKKIKQRKNEINRKLMMINRRTVKKYKNKHQHTHTEWKEDTKRPNIMSAFTKLNTIFKLKRSTIFFSAKNEMPRVPWINDLSFCLDVKLKFAAKLNGSAKFSLQISVQLWNK